MVLDNSSWIISNANNIIKWATVIFLILAVIYLVLVSIIVQDLRYPREHPILFTIETLLFSLGCAAVIFLMAYGRGDITLVTVLEFFVVALKFGVLHILLQFSGFYSYVFEYPLVASKMDNVKKAFFTFVW